jgi:hypothetical protein
MCGERLTRFVSAPQRAKPYVSSPGELSNVVSYLLTEQETVAANANSGDLSQRRIKVNVYGPVWSSLAFLAVILTATCLYVRRTDF